MHSSFAKLLEYSRLLIAIIVRMVLSVDTSSDKTQREH